MPKFNYAAGRILESLQFISKEMTEFKNDYSDKTLRDYKNDTKLQKLMDRTVENILTALIEVCGTLNTENGISFSNYQEAIKECAKFLKFTDEQQNKLGRLANLRNRLAHRYLNFRWQVIRTFHTEMNLVTKLIEVLFKREETKAAKRYEEDSLS
jgi:uncharacterized protein YutE (UPF0331/DUF86 family)